MESVEDLEQIQERELQGEDSRPHAPREGKVSTSPAAGEFLLYVLSTWKLWDPCAMMEAGAFPRMRRLSILSAYYSSRNEEVLAAKPA